MTDQWDRRVTEDHGGSNQDGDTETSTTRTLTFQEQLRVDSTAEEGKGYWY